MFKLIGGGKGLSSKHDPIFFFINVKYNANNKPLLVNWLLAEDGSSTYLTSVILFNDSTK